MVPPPSLVATAHASPVRSSWRARAIRGDTSHKSQPGSRLESLFKETPMSDAAHDDGSIDVVVVPRTHELSDNFEVRRAIPSRQRRMVGPYVFLDQMGPHVFLPGHGLDVRPHPHIGLATVTYLYEGEILHRDSLGVVQPIRPGEVNWMTAGRGIVHSERTASEARERESPLFGIQCWVALPESHEESEPGFLHVGKNDLPEEED